MRTFIVLLCIIASFMAGAQEVVVHITAKCSGIVTPIDSIVIVNYTQPDTLILQQLPQEITTYDVNLSQGILINGVENHITPGQEISLIINQAGFHEVQASLTKREKLRLSLYLMDGKMILQNTFECKPGSNLFDIKTGRGAFYILVVGSDKDATSFKLIGNPHGDGLFDIKSKNASFDKNMNNSKDEIPSGGFLFSPGDQLRFTAKKLGIYANYIQSVPQDGDSIFIPVSKPCPGTPTVIDFDGNVYHTVQIGSQCWMRENINSTHYADGTPLVDGTGVGSIYGDNTTKYWFNYNDDPSFSVVYGKLYTGSAIMNGIPAGNDGDTVKYQGICPNGWHVSTDKEWMRMEAFLGMGWDTNQYYQWRGYNQALKIKEKDTLHWLIDNATNESGFTGLGSGLRGNDGNYYWNRDFTIWWTTSRISQTILINRIIDSLDWTIYRGGDESYNGYSCRCIKN